jgi:predicted HicB family RNase H-like nuclease
MTTLLEHKGYYGSADYSPEDEVFHGKLEFIRDLVTYESGDAKGLKVAFEEAVEDYLAFCAEQGRQPNVPLKGSFNVRTGRDLHRRAVVFAKRKGLNLNSVLTEALKSYLDRHDSPV